MSFEPVTDPHLVAMGVRGVFREPHGGIRYANDFDRFFEKFETITETNLHLLVWPRGSFVTFPYGNLDLGPSDHAHAWARGITVHSGQLHGISVCRICERVENLTPGSTPMSAEHTHHDATKLHVGCPACRERVALDQAHARLTDCFPPPVEAEPVEGKLVAVCQLCAALVAVSPPGTPPEHDYVTRHAAFHERVGA